MLLKIVKDRQNAKVEVNNDATLSDLANVIEEKFQSHGYTFDILMGYPPKVVGGEGNASLTSLGLKNGEVITLRENVRKKETFDGLTLMGFTADVIIRTFNLLDPATLSLDEAVEICMQMSSTDGEVSLPRQKVTRRIIDADNSCLFNAIGFCLCGGESNFRSFSPMTYRKVIADAVLADPATYTADMLDKPPQEYANWIVNPEKWGGEIELFILAQHLKVEIVAVDIRTGNFLTYGENSSVSNRIYVMYDGAHYDAVTRAKGPLTPEECVFDRSDNETFQAVTELAKTLKEAKQFINLATGGLECKICFTRLDGEKAAVEHAKNTGHQNFGQV